MALAQLITDAKDKSTGTGQSADPAVVMQQPASTLRLIDQSLARGGRHVLAAAPSIF
jgi:hypothetical protein